MAMRKIIVNDKSFFYFDNRFFEINGTQFCLTGTVLTGRGIHDAIHTVKNMVNGKSEDYEMIDLIKIFQKYGQI